MRLLSPEPLEAWVCPGPKYLTPFGFECVAWSQTRGHVIAFVVGTLHLTVLFALALDAAGPDVALPPTVASACAAFFRPMPLFDSWSAFSVLFALHHGLLPVCNV